MLERLRAWLNVRAYKKRRAEEALNGDEPIWRDPPDNFYGNPYLVMRIRRARNGRMIEAIYATGGVTQGKFSPARALSSGQMESLVYLVPEEMSLADAFSTVAALAALEE